MLAIKAYKAATQAALDKAWNLANGKYTVRSVLEGYTPEPEKPKYYNGKVVCVDLNGCNGAVYTVGKVYTVSDGVLTADRGKRLRLGNPVQSFEDWCKFSGSKFIEFKGEA